jgi:hypothetical protein
MTSSDLCYAIRLFRAAWRDAEPVILYLGSRVSDNTPKSRLAKLYFERDAKFDEIASCLSRELYPSSISEADREHLIEEAEELTDNWAAADDNHRKWELSTALQVLLSEHQEICKQIIKILDSGEL